MLQTELQLSILYWRLKSENVEKVEGFWMADLSKFPGLKDFLIYWQSPVLALGFQTIVLLMIFFKLSSLVQ